MIGFYDYTMWLTYIGFLSGMSGIICAINDKLFPAILCLLFSGLCDMFDGKVARTKEHRSKDEKVFGMQLDSLSDLVCFGVLPAVIGYTIIREHNVSMLFLPILLCFPLCGLIRLAYFNVLEINKRSIFPTKHFIGLPITSSALVFPAVYALKKFTFLYFPYIYLVTVVVLGILFISNFKIKKPGARTMILFIIIGVIEIIIIYTIRKFL